MVFKRTAVPLAVAAAVALAAPAAFGAQAPDPVAHAAGGDAPALNPAIVGVPISRLGESLDNAADAVDAGKGATAAGPLRASRRYLIRSYRGAKYLIANAPPPAADEGSASPRTFKRLARRFIRAERSRKRSGSRWITAHASDEPAGPVLADAPTAVFNVLTSQYTAATTGIGMLADVRGNLLKRVRTTVNTAVILRNRLVKVVAAAEPPAPEGEDARAAQEEEVATFAAVMPGLAVLLGDEIQQIKATQADTSVPAASRAALADVLSADQAILNRVNTLWPPAVDD